MFSLRAFSRAVPKTSFRSMTSRSFSAIARTSALRPAYTAISRPAYRSFTTSPYRWESAGQFDAELSAKLENELSLEKDSNSTELLPEELQDFIENSGFALQDTPGSEEVILTKNFGNETIKVSFSVADLNNDLGAEHDQYDPALEEEGLEEALGDLTPHSTGPRSKDTINSGRAGNGSINVAPEDRVAPADRPELTDEEDGLDSSGQMEPGFAVRVNITITKPNGQALQLDTIAEDGTFEIESVYHFSSADLAEAKTVDKDFARQNIYAGPLFENLDDELQVLFHRYLEDRGIDVALANFIPGYIYEKEQKEYLNWLDNVKGFIDA